MPRHPLLRPLPIAIVALGFVLLALTDPTQAAETARRLKIDLEVKRDGTVQQGAEQGRGKLVQQLSLSVVLTSDGTPMVNNPLDPEDGRRQLERAQRTQQKVQAAQAKVGYAPATSLDASAMQARAQQLMAKCGQDRASCKAATR